MTYDDWLADGPPITCADCGTSLGRLNDGMGQVVRGDHVCDECAEERDERADETMRAVARMAFADLLARRLADG